MNKTTNYQKQRGAVAIEFAALFLVFFITLYAIIAYSVPILLQFSFQHTSVEAGRAIYKVSPGQPLYDYQSVLGDKVNSIIEDSWLPASWRQGDCPEPETEKSYSWHALKKADNGVSYGHFALDESNLADPRFILHTCIERGYNKDGEAEQRAIIPIINFFGVNVPSLPIKDGKTIIRGQVITRL